MVAVVLAAAVPAVAAVVVMLQTHTIYLFGDMFVN
jgi:hypothetical protein